MKATAKVVENKIQEPHGKIKDFAALCVSFAIFAV
jgi:hypothetical protein